jgi:hypothetical protein
MELDLVEDAGGKCELRGSGALDHHLRVAAASLARVIAVVTSFT